MPRVENSIIINASRDHVIAIARDNEAFPTFMEDVQSIVIKERSAEGLRVVTDWVGIVPKFGNKIRWTQEDIWDLTEGTGTFRQLTGDYDQFEGVWKFTSETPETTRFDSLLDYRLEIPLVGSIIKAIVHKTMQNNLDATLKAIKKRCESQ